jgi:hypothetical protein
MSNFAIHGDKRMKKLFRSLENSSLLHRRAAQQLFLEGELIMTDSKKTTPVKYGTLRASGIVEPPEVKKENVTVVLGSGGFVRSGKFAGEWVGYAIPVHERVEVPHKVGTAKYLERPFKEALPGVEKRLGVNVRSSIRKVVRIQK